MLHADKRKSLGHNLVGLDLAWLTEKVASTCLGNRLRRGHGAKMCEITCAAVLLLLLYMWQLQIMMFAFKTDTLPVARDVCTQYRWLHHEAKTKYVGEAFIKFETFLFLNSTSASAAVHRKMRRTEEGSSGVTRWANSTHLHEWPEEDIRKWTQEGCSEKAPKGHEEEEERRHKPWMYHPYSDFYRMTGRDRMELMRDYWFDHIIAAVFLFLLLFGSQISLGMHGKMLQKLTDQTNSNSIDVAANRKQIDANKAGIDRNAKINDRQEEDLAKIRETDKRQEAMIQKIMNSDLNQDQKIEEIRKIEATQAEEIKRIKEVDAAQEARIKEQEAEIKNNEAVDRRQTQQIELIQQEEQKLKRSVSMLEEHEKELEEREKEFEKKMEAKFDQLYGMILELQGNAGGGGRKKKMW